MTMTVVRGLVAEEDISLGEGSFTRYGSSGVLEAKTKLNASHLPLLAATGAKSATGQTMVDGAISEIYEYIGTGDTQTLAPVSGSCQVTALWEYYYVGHTWEELNTSLITALLKTTRVAVNPTTGTGEYIIFVKSDGSADQVYWREPSDGTINQVPKKAYLDSQDTAYAATAQGNALMFV